MMNAHCTNVFLSDDLVEYEWTELFTSKKPWNTLGGKHDKKNEVNESSVPRGTKDSRWSWCKRDVLQ